MRRYFSMAALFACAVSMLSACAGNLTSPPAANGAQSASRRARHTPAFPPARRHWVSGADRARSRAGGWQPVLATAPWTTGAGTEMLMTDGTVMVQDACTSTWYALVPDQQGNYVNGTWVKRASMPSNYGPLYFASAVLPDGKLIVNGGEYNFCTSAETTLGAIYDPVANSWNPVTGPPGWSSIGDAQSAVLDDGTYMLGNCCTSQQALLKESNMSWNVIGTGKNDVNSEEGWTLLRNGQLLVPDVNNAPASELFNPKTKNWKLAATIPVNLTSGFEIGPQPRRPNGTVFAAGASGATAIYHEHSKKWTTGPTFPIVGGQQLDTADAPATVLVDGTVLLPASPGLYNSPSTFFIFDGTALRPIAGPPQAPNDSSYNIRLLVLPTGQVLETDQSSDVEVFTSNRPALKNIAPSIASVSSKLKVGSTYTISGTHFNGVTQANMYGDDAQQATNYPLVRLTNAATGHVYYARTHGHSFMGVDSPRSVSTKFDVPATIETGAATLVVVANGIASAPVNVTIR